MSVGGSCRPGVYRFCATALYVGLRAWNRIQLVGRERIPATGGCLVVANHVSYLDPPALGSGVWHRPFRYLARESLFRPPWFGTLLRWLGVMPLSGTGDVAALRSALRCLQEGHCVALFPEGTRSPDGQIREAKAGIGFLIAKARVPVVPAYIDGTFAAWPRGGKFIRPHKVRVFYGPPILPDEVDAAGSDREAYERIARLVMDRIRDLREQHAKPGIPAGDPRP